MDRGGVWIHLDGTHKGTEAWLRARSGLSTYVVDGLVASETRPRCEAYDDGVLLILRGVNLNPGAEPEDMVSIRIWIDQGRVISTRLRRLMAVQDIRDQLEAGKGPVSSGHLVARLAARLTERMGPVVGDLSDQVGELEDRMIGADGNGQLDLREARYRLVGLRRVAILLRRYVSPQREALTRLSQMEEAWLDGRVRGRLREVVDGVTRIVEELDEVRERSTVIQDELVNRISQRIERTMYILTLVATIMLPLGFLTGLLGINVGGIPGAEASWAFWAVCGALAALVGLELWVLKRLKWL
ncbi:MAG: zinc transporter ZntB [Gammaproteobacteria bacterium]|nr:zinc transporter ZntB [Gammaproteobacteria bacterium]